MRAAYPAIKDVAPALPVLMSMAGTDTSFLASLYADGVRGYYDGIAVRPYDQRTLSRLKALRAYEVSQGDTAPIWSPRSAGHRQLWAFGALGVQGRARTSARLIAVRRP